MFEKTLTTLLDMLGLAIITAIAISTSITAYSTVVTPFCLLRLACDIESGTSLFSIVSLDSMSVYLLSVLGLAGASATATASAAVVMHTRTKTRTGAIARWCLMQQSMRPGLSPLASRHNGGYTRLTMIVEVLVPTSLTGFAITSGRLGSKSATSARLRAQSARWR